MSIPNGDYFVAGGSLGLTAPSYVSRPADRELPERLLEGNYCYVLTCRQMGKSSLMVRTAAQLRAAGVVVAIVDLTAIGAESTDRDSWYLSVLSRIQRGLRLEVDLSAWWESRHHLSAAQRFGDFLRDVALEQRSEPMVVFIDEIDNTLSFDQDVRTDFFLAIRALYNDRPNHASLCRLSFALIGAANPADLIKQDGRTPFNIGRRIDLVELRRSDAAQLREGLTRSCGDQAGAILDRIFDWTNGHPYMTQRLCKLVAEQPGLWDNQAVDDLVADTFLSEAGRRDYNLATIQDRVSHLEPGRKRRLLALYEQVYRGRPIADSPNSTAQGDLEIFGLVRVIDGKLHIRNRIYQRAFDQAWINTNRPPSADRQLWIAAATMTAIIMAVVIITVLTRSSDVERARIAEEQFRTGIDNSVKVNALADLITIIAGDDPYSQRALELYYDDTPNKADLFTTTDLTGVGASVVTVADTIGRTLDPEQMPDWEAQMDAMTTALRRATNEARAGALINTFDTWRAARSQRANNLLEAIESYQSALKLSPDHPVLQYELAVAQIQAEQFDAALATLEQLVTQAAQAKPTPTVVTTPTVDASPTLTATAPHTPTSSATTAVATPSPGETPQTRPTLPVNPPRAEQVYGSLRFRDVTTVLDTVQKLVNSDIRLAGRVNVTTHPAIAGLMGVPDPSLAARACISNLVPYTDPAGSYSVLIPENWIVEPKPSSVIVFRPDESFLPYSRISINTSSSPRQLSADEQKSIIQDYVVANFGVLTGFLIDDKIIKTENAAIAFRYSLVDSSGATIAEISGIGMIVQNGQTVVALIIETPSLCDNADNVSQEILDSFQFTAGVTSSRPYVEPAFVPCLAGSEQVLQVQGTVRRDIPAQREFTYTFESKDPATVEVVGYAKEGHPERGCPGGADCGDVQLFEEFTVAVNSQVIGTYADKGDIHEWVNFGLWASSPVPTGRQTLVVRHLGEGEGAQAVDFKLTICVRPAGTASPTAFLPGTPSSSSTAISTDTGTIPTISETDTGTIPTIAP